MREKEVTDLVERGGWPDAATADLRTHAAECATCGRTLMILQAFRRDRAHAISAARLESPGVLWWRAQLRRRNAALEKIGRPLLGAQIFAVAMILIAALAVLGFEAEKGPGSGQGWRSWLQQMPHAVSLNSLHLEALLPAALQTSGGVWVTAAVVAMLALVTGVIAWVAAEKH
jgi:hypothetical protein